MYPNMVVVRIMSVWMEIKTSILSLQGQLLAAES